MKKILLNCLPPTATDSPIPSLSVLKSFLEKKGYYVEIKYWNLILEKYFNNFLNFGSFDRLNDFQKIIPFLSYIAIKEEDSETIDKLLLQIINQKPQYHVKGNSFLLNHLKEKSEELNNIIISELDQINFSDYLLIGFTSLFYQWIPASIIATKIKYKYKNKIIIGGFGTKAEAECILSNFSCFDFSCWGESENTALTLCNALCKNDDDLTQISQLCYWNNNLLVTNTGKIKYADLNIENDPNYDDFFSQNVDENLNNKYLPIEGGRGCHWKKCKFCYLNTGYKFRVKSNSKIIEEVEKQIEKYGVPKFQFLDNDIIGSDRKKFIELIEELINIKDKNNDFEIIMAEIITKGIDFNIIKKMKLAGFSGVQIGYESPSSELLKKINKKNSFASNLLFIKWANHLNIRVYGLNILRNLLEETEEDIKESIENLKMLRFYLKENGTRHSYSHLAIKDSSRYYREIDSNNNLINWNSSPFYELLPNNFINNSDRFILFDFIKKDYHVLWDFFEKYESYYIENNFTFKLIKNNSIITYFEMLNDNIINELDFEEDVSIHWMILEFCNNKVKTLEECSDLILKKHLLTKKQLYEIIEELRIEGLLYHNFDFSEIVTIINTNNIY